MTKVEKAAAEKAAAEAANNELAGGAFVKKCQNVVVIFSICVCSQHVLIFHIHIQIGWMDSIIILQVPQLCLTLLVKMVIRRLLQNF